MQKNWKNLTAVIGAAALSFALLPNACVQAEETEQNDIIILYTNDVHCAIDENIGYSGLAAYKKEMLEKTPYVTLVDAGDAVQGDLMGTVSEGEYIVDLMNDVGYDYAILGNHEFDYGLDQLSYLIDSASATYLGCDISYTGSGENALEGIQPYALEQYGDVTVGFIGVSTPYSITSSTPKYFMDENGDFVYNFYNESGETFYDCVQGYVDTCREEGADYVILITHLGEDDSLSPFSSVELIQNTNGVDAVLDGHAHSTISSYVTQNKDGEDVLLSSTGTKLANIGQLVITANGNISTGLISHYEEKDEEMDEMIDNIKATYEEEMNEVVATSDTALLCTDADGIRLVRNRETTIGNFCADAYRYVADADIAIVNGGGIRADLPAGDITYADVLAVHPYGNTLCMVEATGQEVLDALEFGSRLTEAEYAEEGSATGESGGFLQVSGLRYTIDTSIPSSATVDENGLFVSIDGEYRVKDVEVLQEDGTYAPLDLEATYTVASHNYLIQDCGDGFSMFEDNEMLIDKAAADYQMLITYITEKLDGDLSAYGSTEGRITVE
jgi:2',3'-cyclic-nucleotide 2'-phosphodiesterase (5'-nucleotidase family)